jgi:tRNA-2-methylthio-N6-dimethylallyladenosine synthase
MLKNDLALDNANLNKYYLVTFGCQMNDRDSQALAGMLEELGYGPASCPEEARIIIHNTCCVRGNAENRLYGHLGNLKPLKDADPRRIIGVCGCMVQQASEREKIEKDYPYVDLVFGTHNIHRLPILLQRVNEGERVIEVWDDSKASIQEDLPIRREDPYRALVTIMYGCNNFCSYCIVPYVRGRERSRKPEDILREIKALVASGVREITLLGQNVNSYGKDFAEPIAFADLLAEINRVDGLRRIRFTTSHPKDLSPNLIAAMRDLDKVCEHLHLPVQSGSTRILERMNRRYTREQYLQLVKELRAAVPEIVLTTDIIVGFPGETEEDFQETVSIVREAGYEGAFTFAYSPRIGTAAASYADAVPEEVRMDRLYRLNEVVSELALAGNQRLVGKTLEIMVEGPSDKNPEVYTGRTRSNKQVLFAPDERRERLIGEEIPVAITEGKTWTLSGEIKENNN